MAAAPPDTVEPAKKTGRSRDRAHKTPPRTPAKPAVAAKPTPETPAKPPPDETAAPAGPQPAPPPPPPKPAAEPPALKCSKAEFASVYEVAVPPPGAVRAALRKLKACREAGAITDAEFDRYQTALVAKL